MFLSAWLKGFSDSHPYQKNSSPSETTQSLKAANSHFKNFLIKPKTHRGCKTALCGRRASVFPFRSSFHRVGQRERWWWEKGRGTSKGVGVRGDKGGRIPMGAPLAWGEREQMAVENVALKAPKKGRCWQTLLLSYWRLNVLCVFAASGGGNRLLFPATGLGTSGGRITWECIYGAGRGQQLWPQRAGRPRGVRVSTAFSWPGQERSAQNWSLPWQRWRKGQWLGPSVSASSPTPKGTGGGLPNVNRYWEREMEENIPNAFRGLKLQ